MEENSEILVSVLERVLEKCNKKYSYILKEGESLVLFETLPEPDESVSIGIMKKTGSLEYYIGGTYFLGTEPEPGNTAQDVVEALKELNIKISPEKMISRFRGAIKTPLGNYLAEKELEGLEKELL